MFGYILNPEEEYTMFEYIFFTLLNGSFYLLLAAIILSPFLFIYGKVIATFFPKPIFIHNFFKAFQLSPLHKRILERDILFYQKLNSRHKKYFEHRVLKFLNKYKIEGRDGLIITEEIKVMIAACYTKLNFGKVDYISNAFDKIILFPKAFLSPYTSQMHVGEFNPSRSLVVLSWHHFKFGYENNTNNLNVGLHEFAHVLKHESLRSFDRTSMRFSRNLKRLKNMIQQTGKMDRLVSENYLRNSAFYDNHEFFAVLVEHYFETPHLMKQKYPLLFRSMTKLLNFDDYLYTFELQ